MQRKIKTTFLAGLAVIVPVGLTLYILSFLIGLMDGLLNVMPRTYHPDQLLGVHIPGLGAIATVILIFVVGLVVQSYLGNKMVLLGEGLVDKIPVVRTLYQALKRIVDSLFVGKGRGFKKVVLIQYPRPGIFSVGFVTGEPNGELQGYIPRGEPFVGVFLPMALTPTTGYFVMVPEKDVIPLGISVEEAFALIISAGIVTPQGRENSSASPP